LKGPGCCLTTKFK